MSVTVTRNLIFFRIMSRGTCTKRFGVVKLHAVLSNTQIYKKPSDTTFSILEIKKG